MSTEIPFCPDPFTFLSRDSIRFLTCCPGWMDESRFIYGEFDNLWQVWNHPKLIEWRKALLDGDYRWCQRCPNRFRPRERTSPLPDEKAVMERPPITYQFLDDQLCNLRCPSCRPHQITEIADKPWPVQRVIAEFHGLKTVAMSLSGDPFASPECMEYLRGEGLPDAILWTNGILLPRSWSQVRRHVPVILLSVDAATRETYERLRVPAKWEQVQNSLSFIGDLVDAGDVQIFQVNMVVQRDNFREIPAFIRMAKQFGAHKVQFCLIAPWPHITPERWMYVNIANPWHPEFLDFMEVLRDPLLADPVVDAGFLSGDAIQFYGAAKPGTNFWHDPARVNT